MDVRLISKGSEHLQTGMVDDSGTPVIRMADLSSATQKEVIRFLCREEGITVQEGCNRGDVLDPLSPEYIVRATSEILSFPVSDNKKVRAIQVLLED
jgi:hypothetical protein